MDPVIWCGTANLSNRVLIEKIYLNYIEAGVEIIIPNTCATMRNVLLRCFKRIKNPSFVIPEILLRMFTDR